MKNCPSCGMELAGSSTGLCPACLLLEGLNTVGAGASLPAASNSETTAADTFGPYLILHSLGEGGMGSFYLAEQTHPIRRFVALKVVKLGMDTLRVLSRFTVAFRARSDVMYAYAYANPTVRGSRRRRHARRAPRPRIAQSAGRAQIRHHGRREARERTPREEENGEEEAALRPVSTVMVLHVCYVFRQCRVSALARRKQFHLN